MNDDSPPSEVRADLDVARAPRPAAHRPRLFHVSEQPGIERFEPRLPPAPGEAVGIPVVWAVDQAHLPNYLLPRDCPRVAFRPVPATTASDRERFLSGGGGAIGTATASAPGTATAAATAAHVVAIEAAWFERASTCTLWVYEFAPEAFTCRDATAGYFVAVAAVVPIDCRRVERPLAELRARGAQLRVLPSLHGLAAAVAASTLAFSCIRMRHAGSA